MTTSANIGYGCKFQIGNSATPTVYTDMAEVTSFTPPALTTDTIDATHMGSPDGIREKIPGLVDPGEATVEMNFIPGNAGQEALIAALVARTLGEYRIVWNDGAETEWDFQAYVTGFEVSSVLEDKMTATVTFTVATKPSYA